ncbi:hypothetical protein NLZ15_17540 [Atlantibacter subterranea]|uniref:hypothetical protein n=1 Tax=Atlantibacter subterraneus TaxID=255519 RepID=UPI0020C236B2|nr:hypothetical protein [Atlantibacter subterranea]UTJ46626.1 hypothetical protein NLZ15_17540 [Atlantibacter subterranea]
MKIDLEVKATGVEVSPSGYRDFVDVEIRGVDVTDMLSEIQGPVLYEEIELDDFIDWADGKGKSSDILARLDADEVIDWLRSNWHLEAENG